MRTLLLCLATALTVLIVGCSSQPISQGIQYENLIQPFPLPGGKWKANQKKDNDMLETVWKNKNGKKLLHVYVLYNDKESPEFLKKFDDKQGKKACDQFDSTFVNKSNENGYLTLTWYGICRKSNGYYSKGLHKIIKGKDATYVLLLVWLSEPSKQDWASWVDYFKKIYVCDSRNKNHPCPEGYKKQGNSLSASPN